MTDLSKMPEEDRVQAIDFVTDLLHTISKRLLDAGEYRSKHLPPTLEILGDVRMTLIDMIKRRDAR